MSENVVFTPDASVQQPQPAALQPVSVPQSPPGAPPEQVPPVPSDLPAPSKKGLIIKIAVGVVIAVILLFTIVRFVLPMFGGNKPTSGGNAKLIYWGLWEDSTVMKPLIDEFTRQHPNVSIEYSKVDIKQYRQRLMTRIENGDGPDIFRYHNTWVPMLSSVLLPLPDDVVKPADFAKTFYPVMQKDLVRKGAIYGIPLSLDTMAMFVNTEILDAGNYAVPKDWEDFIKVAKSVTVQDGEGNIKTAGAALGSYDNINHAPDIISVLFAQNGADIYNLEKTKQFAAETLTFYTKFVSEADNVWDDDLESSRTMFAKGNLAMYFGYSWDIFAIQALNPELKFEVHQIPTIPGATPLTMASYWVEGVSAKSKYPKEAMLFLKYLAQKETEQRFYKAAVDSGRPFGEIYARKDLQDTLKDNKLVYPFVKQADSATSSFFVSDTFDDGINSQANAYLGDAVRSILKGDSAETAVETLAQGVAQKLKQYGR